MQSHTLLIVEDSHASAAILQRIVEKTGVWTVVDWVPDVEAAAAVLAAAKPDVVTLDLGMPGGGGFRLLSLMRDQPHVPVIVVSASTYEGSPAVAEALSRGADACFDKTRILSHASEFIKMLEAAIAAK